VQHPDDVARNMVEEFISTYAIKKSKPATPPTGTGVPTKTR